MIEFWWNKVGPVSRLARRYGIIMDEETKRHVSRVSSITYGRLVPEAPSRDFYGDTTGYTLEYVTLREIVEADGTLKTGPYQLPDDSGNIIIEGAVRAAGKSESGADKYSVDLICRPRDGATSPCPKDVVDFFHKIMVGDVDPVDSKKKDEG